MTRLRFLLAATMAALTAAPPWRRKYTVDEWCAKHGLALEFQHRPANDDLCIMARSLAILKVRNAPGVSEMISRLDVGPAEFEKWVKETLLGTTHRFYASEWKFRILSGAPPESWTGPAKSSLDEGRRTLVREVYFPSGLIV